MLGQIHGEEPPRCLSCALFHMHGLGAGINEDITCIATESSDKTYAYGRQHSLKVQLRTLCKLWLWKA